MSGSWIRSILLAVAPAAIVLALMLSEGVIAIHVAAILGLAILLGAGIAVRRRLTAEKIVMRRLNRLTAEAQAQLDALSYKAAVADRIVSSLPHPIFFLDRDRRVVRPVWLVQPGRPVLAAAAVSVLASGLARRGWQPVRCGRVAHRPAASAARVSAAGVTCPVVEAAAPWPRPVVLPDPVFLQEQHPRVWPRSAPDWHLPALPVQASEQGGPELPPGQRRVRVWAVRLVRS